MQSCGMVGPAAKSGTTR